MQLSEDPDAKTDMATLEGVGNDWQMSQWNAKS
jgi:hypothetical protein